MGVPASVPLLSNVVVQGLVEPVCCHDAPGSLAMVANVGGRMSGAGSPRKSTLGKAGAPTENMKNKGAEAEPAKDQRPDRRYEEPFEDKRGHTPPQSE